MNERLQNNENLRFAKSSEITPQGRSSRISDVTSSLAIKFTCKRLSLIFAPAIFVLVVPPILSMAKVILDFLTKGHAFICIFFSVGITSLACVKIKEFAPSAKQSANALQSRHRIFGYAWLFSTIFCRQVISVIFPNDDSLNKSFRDTNMFLGARLAVGIFFLSFLVALRFVGPLAIAQCSTFPLPQNPYEKIFYNMSSFTRIIDQLAVQESEQASTQQRKTIEGKGPMRYRSPSLLKSVLQIALHGFFGALFAQSFISPILLEQNAENAVVYHSILSCALLSIFTFFATYISNDNHELSPKSHLEQKILVSIWKQIQESRSLFYWITLQIPCLLFVFRLQDEAFRPMTILHALLVSLPITLFMSLYIMASDITIRAILTQRGLNTNRFIMEAGDNCDATLVEVILGGLGSTILEYVISPRLKIDRDGKVVLPSTAKKRGRLSADCDLEEEELRRNDAMIKFVKDCIEKGQICGHTSFEDDLLKVMILESFGGGTSDGQEGSQLPLGLSQRHYNTVARRIAVSETKFPGAQSTTVPILRAISAYLGGIGAALSEPGPKFLSPSMLLCCEYGVMAATRFIVLNMVAGHDSSGNLLKRFNRTSLVLPVVLESIYRLRSGFYDYALHLSEREHASKAAVEDVTRIRLPRKTKSHQAGEIALSLYPASDQMINICDEAAVLILKSLKEVDGIIDFDAKVRVLGGKQWLNSLLH